MKGTLLVVFIAFFCNISFAQTLPVAAGTQVHNPATDSIPKYQKIGTIPDFKIMIAPDSAAFTNADLKKDMETIIMVFSPDCDHCIHSVKDMLDNYKDLKNVQIIMGTPLAYSHVQKFHKEYAIDFYPAIKMGVDNNYTFGTFYEVHMFPAIFLYDKHGKFRKAFNGNSKWAEIAKAL